MTSYKPELDELLKRPYQSENFTDNPLSVLLWNMEKEVYRGQIVKVTEESIDGILWERVYLPDGVIVLPVTDDGKILLVKEKRPHENPPVRIKPVSGILESDKGSAEENAQREMQEEIGFRATTLETLLVQKGSGTVNSTQYYFVARGLIPSKLPNPDGEHTIIEIQAYTPEEILEKLHNGEIRWSHSTLGILKLINSMR
jgi:8-oxo-dGTP pyrophosphatase MutT (NUDIX family)